MQHSFLLMLFYPFFLFYITYDLDVNDSNRLFLIFSQCLNFTLNWFPCPSFSVLLTEEKNDYATPLYLCGNLTP